MSTQDLRNLTACELADGLSDAFALIEAARAALVTPLTREQRQAAARTLAEMRTLEASYRHELDRRGA